MFILELVLSLQIFLSFVFLKTINPLPLSLILIALAFLEGLIAWCMVSKWLGLALIMVFVGGMMVAFLYVSSLTFNLKFQSFVPNGLWLVLMMMILFTPLEIMKEFSTNFSIKVFSLSSSFIMVFLICYLLIVLFLAVKITESLKGSLAQKF